MDEMPVDWSDTELRSGHLTYGIGGFKADGVAQASTQHLMLLFRKDAANWRPREATMSWTQSPKSYERCVLTRGTLRNSEIALSSPALPRLPVAMPTWLARSASCRKTLLYAHPSYRDDDASLGPNRLTAARDVEADVTRDHPITHQHTKSWFAFPPRS